MAVFITGGHGHVGSWTAYLLAKAGEKIIIYDMNPDPPDLLAEAEVSAHITFIRGDVMDFPRLTGVFRTHGGQIEGIIHTVAVMGQFVTANPHGNVLLNIGGFLNVLEAARLFHIRKILYTSIGAVAKLAQRHSHFPSRVEIGPGTLLPRCEALDITRAKKELGYWPKYGLEQGIQHYANWLAQVLKGR
jgi:nucleoside-diphosphate-sugar epimerase